MNQLPSNCMDSASLFTDSSTNLLLQQPYYDILLTAVRLFGTELPVAIYVNQIFEDGPLLLPAQIISFDYRVQLAFITVQVTKQLKSQIYVSLQNLITPTFKNIPYDQLIVDQKCDILIAYKLIKSYPSVHKDILSQIFGASSLIVFNQKIKNTQPIYMKFNKLPLQMIQGSLLHCDYFLQLQKEITFSNSFIKLKLQFANFVRKTYGGILTKYISAIDFSNDVLSILGDLDIKSKLHSLPQIFYQCVNKTRDNIISLQQRMSAGKANSNDIHYNTLMLWLFTSEIYPLCQALWIKQFIAVSQDLLNEKVASNLVKTISSSEVYELTNHHLNQFNQYILEGRSVNKFKVELFLRLQSNAFSVDLPMDGFFLENYVPSIEIPIIDSPVSQQISKEIIQSWYLSLPLVIVCFSSISVDYTINFNYSNLSYMTQARSIQQSALLTGGKEVTTDIDVNSYELYKILSLFPQYYNRFQFYPINFESFLTQYNSLMDNTIHINTLLYKFYNPENFNMQYLQYKKLNSIQSNISSIICFQSIADTNLLPKKISDFLLLPVFQLQSHKYIQNYEELNEILASIDQQVIELSGLKNSKLFALLIHLDISQKIDNLLLEYDKLKYTICNDQEMISKRFIDKITTQIMYCRMVINSSQCSPQLFFLINDLKELFSKQLLLSLKYNIGEIFEQNYKYFVHTFKQFQDKNSIYQYIDQIAEYFLKPINQFNHLIFDVQHQLTDFQLNKQDIVPFVREFDIFIMKILNKCQYDISSLASFDKLQIIKSFSDFHQLSEDQFPHLLECFDIQKFDFQANNVVEKCFLQSMARISSLKIESKNFSNKLLLSNYSINQKLRNSMFDNFSFKKRDKFYTVGDFIREIHYVLVEMMIISTNLQYWRCWIVSEFNNYPDISFLKNPIFVSPYSLMQKFSCVYDIIVIYDWIKASLDLNFNQPLRLFQCEQTMQYMDRLISSVGRFKSLCQKPVTISSNKSDYLKQKQLYISFSVKENDISQLVFDKVQITFSNWVTILELVEPVIKDMYPKVVSLYILKKPTLKSVHYQAISQFARFTIDKNLECQVGAVCQLYKQNLYFLDFMYVMYINSMNDQAAMKQIKDIQSSINTIRVCLTFPNQISKSYYIKLPERNPQIDISNIQQVIILPSNFENICVEAYVSVSRIINNADYIGDRLVETSTQYEQHIIQQGLNSVKWIQESNLSIFRGYEDILKQCRFPLQIEQKARDIEAVSQILQSFCISLKRTQLMLQDLIQAFTNVCLGSNEQKYISPFDQQSLVRIASYVEKWQYFIQLHFGGQIDICLLKFVLNRNELDVFFQLSSNIFQFSEEIRKDQYCLKKQLRQFPFYRIVPFEISNRCKKQYFTVLLFDDASHIAYHQMGQLNIFQDTSIFSNIFNCITGVTVCNNIIVNIQTQQEILVLKDKCECPKYAYQFLDNLYYQINHCIIQKAQQYFYYTPTLQVYQQLILTEVFEVFVIVFNTYLKYNKINLSKSIFYVRLVLEQHTHIYPQLLLLEFLEQQDNIIYFDDSSKLLLLTDQHQSFIIKVGIHWHGGKTVPYLLNISQKILFKQILQLLQYNHTIILVGCKEYQYQNDNLLQLISEIERLLKQFTIALCVTQNSFEKVFQQIESFILNGYIVLLFGTEFLTQHQLTLLYNLSSIFVNQAGVFQTFLLAEYNQKQQVDFLTCDYHHVVQSNLGRLIIYLPELVSIESSVQFMYSSEDGKTGITRNIQSAFISTINQSRKDIKGSSSHLDGFIFQKSSYLKQFLKNFRGVSVLSIEYVSLLDQYLSINQTYGRQFFDVFQHINSLNNDICKLSTNDMLLIFQKVKEFTPISLTTILLDYIFKQSLFLLQDCKDNIKILQQIAVQLTSCFGVDQQNANLLQNQAKQYFQYFETHLYHLGFKRQTQKINMRQTPYNKYFTEFIQKYYRSEYTSDISTYSQLFCLPIQCICDILLGNELLDMHQPLLLISLQVTYLRFYITILSVIKNAKVYLISFARDYQVLIQQIDVDQSDNNFVIALNPTSENELRTLISMVQQSFVPSKYNHLITRMSILICLDYQLYLTLEHSNKIYQYFKHKLILLPQFAGSLGTKRLFVGNFVISAQHLVYSYQFRKLFQHNDLSIPLGSKLSLSLQSQMQDHQMLKNSMICSEQRAVALQQLIIGIFDVLYDELSKVFQLGSSFEQALIIRSLVQLFLYKSKIIQIIPNHSSFDFMLLSSTQIQTSISELKQLAVYDVDSIGSDSMLRVVIKKYLQHNGINLSDIGNEAGLINDCLSFTRQQLLQNLDSSVDLGGFLKNTFQKYFTQLKTSLDLQDDIDTGLQQSSKFYTDSDLYNYGYGFNGSLKFKFTDQFLEDSYFNAESHQKAFQNIIFPFIVALWNSAQLFYTTIFYEQNDKTQTPEKQLIQELIQRYSSFCKAISSLENLNPKSSIQLLSPICALIESELQQFPNFKIDCLQQLSFQNTSKLAFLQHGLTFGQVGLILRKQVKFVASLLPQHFCDSPFTYLSFVALKQSTNKNSCQFHVEFVEFRFGQGILDSLIMNDEVSLVNNDIELMAESSSLFNKLNSGKQFDAQAVFMKYDKHEKLSLQKLGQRKIYFDAQRTAIVVMLAGCLLTPVSVCLIGKEKIGKSTLIYAAQMLVRELIDPHYILMENISSPFYNHAIQQSIANRFVLRSINHQSQAKFIKTDQILAYVQSLAFPVFHFHASSISSNDSISEDLLLLFRDHIINMGNQHQLKIHNSQEKYSGQVNMQDVSFIIETQQNSQLSKIFSIKIEMPHLSKDFLVQLFQLQYPQHNIFWITNFVDGYYLLIRQEVSLFLHNFEIVEMLFQNRYHAIQKRIEIPKKEYVKYSEQFRRQFVLQNIILKGMSFKTNRSIIDYVIHQQKQSIADLIQNNKDYILQDLNAQSLFYTLKQKLSRSHVIRMLERLLAAQMLQLLDSEDLPISPWSSCLQMYHNNFEIIPVWKQYSILNSLIQNVQQTTVAQCGSVDYDLSIYDIKENNTLIKNIGNSFSKHLLISHGFAQQNYRLFLNYMENSFINSQGIDPLVSAGVFKAYINIMQQRELNLARLNSFTQYGSQSINSNSLSGIYSEDEMYGVRQVFGLVSSKQCDIVLQNASKLKQLISNSTNFIQDAKTLIQEDCILTSFSDAIQTSFRGFTYSAALSMRVPQYRINLNLSISNPGEMIMRIIQSFSSYLVFHVDNPIISSHMLEKSDDSKSVTSSDFPNQSSQSNTSEKHLSSNNLQQQQISKTYIQSSKVIINIDSILQRIEAQDELQNDQNDRFQIISYLKKVRFHLSSKYSISDMQLQCSLIIIILRISVVLSLGVKPELVFDFETSTGMNDLDLPINSCFSSKFPFKIIPQGRFLSQLPIQISSFNEMKKRFDVQLNTDKILQTKQQQLSTMTTVPIEVLLIGSHSMFEKIIQPKQVSIYSLLQNMLQPFSILPSIFSEEDLQVLSALACYNYKIETVIDRKFLSCLLASNFTILIIDQSRSLGYENQYPGGIIQSVLFDQFHKLQSQLIIFNYKLNQKLECSYSDIFKSFISNQTFNRQVSQVMIKCGQSLNEYNNNIIPQSLLDIEKLYIISKIRLPQEHIFQTFQFNHQQFKLHIMVALFSSYSFFSSNCTLPIVSFQQFSLITFNLYQVVLNQLSQLDHVFSEIFSIYSKLKQITFSLEQNDDQQKDMDLERVNMQTFNQILDKIIEKIKSKMHQNGQVLTEQVEKLQRGRALTLMCRDYFKKLCQRIQLEIGTVNSILDSLALDVVGCSCYLVFNINGGLNYEFLQEAMFKSTFGDLGSELKLIYQYLNDNVDNQQYDAFILTYLALLQQQGFSIHYSQMNEPYFKGVHNIGFFSSKWGVTQLLYNYMMISKIDSPVCQVLTEHDCQWYQTDPYHTFCTSLLIMWKCSYRNFVCNHKVALMAADCILAQEVKSSLFARYVFDEQIKYSNAVDKVITIDLLDNYINIIHQLQLALSQNHNITIFLNCEKANFINISLVQRLFQMKVDSIVGQQLQFLLGGIQFQINEPLCSKTIFFTISSNGIQQLLQIIGCTQQNQLDQIFYVIMNDKHQFNTLSYYSIQQQMQSKIFGIESSERFRHEEIQAFEVIKYSMYTSLISNLVEFNKSILVDLDNDDVFVQMLNLDAQTQLEVIYDNITAIMKNDSVSKLYIQNILKIEEIGTKFSLKLQKNQISYLNGSHICEQLAGGLIAIFQVFEQLSIVHFPLIAVDHEILVPYILSKLTEKRQDLISIIANQYQEISCVPLPDSSLFRMLEQYPLQYQLYHNPLFVKEFLISSIIPLLTKLLRLFFDDDSYFGVWLIIVTIFLSKVGKLSNENNNIFELIPLLMSRNQTDLIRLSTSQLLVNSFYTHSSFSISRLYTPQRLQQICQISLAKTLQPEICEMSSQMQYAWLTMHIVGRYSKLLQNTLTWFMKNNAAFVNLSQANNPFLSIIRGFRSQDQNQMINSSENSDVQVWLNNVLFKSQHQHQVQTLPPGFNPDSVAFFNSFCISCILIPENLLENIQIFAVVMANSVGQTPSEIIQESNQLPNNSVLNYFQNQTEDVGHSKDLQDNIAKFTSLFGDRFFNTILLDKYFIQLYNFVIQQCHQANSISFIYYDSIFALKEIMIYIVNLVKKKYQLEFRVHSAKNLKGYNSEGDCCILDLESQDLSKEQFQQIEIELKKFRHTIKHPIFLLIPSCCHGTSLNSCLIEQICYDLGDFQYFQQFISRTILEYNSQIVYIKQYTSMFDLVIYSINLLTAIYINKDIDICMDSKSCNYKCLMILCLQYALCIQKGIPTYSDWCLIQQFMIFVQMLKSDISSKLIKQPHCYMQQLLSIEICLDYQDQQILYQIQQFCFCLLQKQEIDVGQLLCDGISLVVTKPRNFAVNMQREDEEVDIKILKKKERNDFERDIDSNDDGDSEEEDTDTTTELDGEKQSVNDNRNQDMEANEFLKQRQKALIHETDVYDPLISQLQLVGHELVKKLNIKLLEESIALQISPKQRKVKLLNPDNKMLDDDYYNKENDFVSPKKLFKLNDDMTGQDFVDKLLLLRDYYQQYSVDLLDDQAMPYDSMIGKVASGGQISEQKTRAILSNCLVKDAVCQLLGDTINHQVIVKSLLNSEMSEQTSLYFQQLQSVSNGRKQLIFPHQDINQYQLLKNILPEFQVNQSQNKENYLFTFETYSVVDASVFFPILGDILAQLKTQNALKCSAPYSTQRVIITAVRPYKQVRILPSGLLDLGNEDDSDVSNLNYIEIRGLRLHNLFYDAHLQTVCDLSTEAMQGFESSFPLFATAICIEGRNMQSHSAPEDSLIVHESYVPVPIRMGGLVQPLVLLENKTMFKSIEFQCKNPYFAIFPI